MPEPEGESSAETVPIQPNKSPSAVTLDLYDAIDERNSASITQAATLVRKAKRAGKEEVAPPKKSAGDTASAFFDGVAAAEERSISFNSGSVDEAKQTKHPRRTTRTTKPPVQQIAPTDSKKSDEEDEHTLLFNKCYALKNLSPNMNEFFDGLKFSWSNERLRAGYNMASTFLGTSTSLLVIERMFVESCGVLEMLGPLAGLNLDGEVGLKNVVRSELKTQTSGLHNQLTRIQIKYGLFFGDSPVLELMLGMVEIIGAIDRKNKSYAQENLNAAAPNVHVPEDDGGVEAEESDITV